MTYSPDESSEQSHCGSDHHTTDADTTDDSGGASLTRRQTLAAIGGGAFAAGTGAATTQFGIGQAAEGGFMLDISLWQTQRMSTVADIERDDPAHALAVLKPWVETYFEPFIETSSVFDDMQVRMRSPSVALDTAGDYDNPSVEILARLLDWNGKLHGQHDPSIHSNLLVDVPIGAPTLGTAFSDETDTMAGKMTNAAILDYGEYLLDLEPGQVTPHDDHVLYINDDRGVNPAEMIAMAAPHEIGHNCKLQHNEGESRLVNDQTPCGTVMAGPHFAVYGALKEAEQIPEANACGKEWHDVEAKATRLGIREFHDDVGLLPTTASQCALRSFENDAREMQRTHDEGNGSAASRYDSGAAGFGRGVNTTGTVPSVADAPELDESLYTVTEIPEAVLERMPEPGTNR